MAAASAGDQNDPRDARIAELDRKNAELEALVAKLVAQGGCDGCGAGLPEVPDNDGRLFPLMATLAVSASCVYHDTDITIIRDGFKWCANAEGAEAVWGWALSPP